MKCITGALCAVFALSATFAGAQGQVSLPRPNPDVAVFARGVKFTVSGYTGTEVLTNFPVLVRLSESTIDGFHYSDFTRADYRDLCFVDMQTNGLPCEVDTWDASGESLVWVTLPRLTNGTEFVMWYHSSSLGSLVCDDNAWTDYAGVWHMNEGGDGAVTISDATLNGLDGTATTSSFAQPNGRIGGARIPTKDGAAKSTERIEVSLNNNTKRSVVDGVNTAADHAFTVSMWIKPLKYNSTFDGPNSAYLMSRKTKDGDTYWGVQFHYDNRNGYKNSIHYGWIRVWRNENNGDNCWHSEFDDSVIPLAASSCYGNWYKLDVVYSGTSVYFYVDGGGTANSCLTNVTNKAPAHNATSSNGKLFLTGVSASSAGRPFRGDLDEFRLRAGAMSADWVKADFDTVDNTSFLSAGSVESVRVREMPFASFSLLDSGAAFATFTGVASSLGEEEATSCDVYYKLWQSSGSEPTTPDDGWTLLRSGLSANVIFTNSVTGLMPGTAYSWKLYAKNDLGDATEEVSSGSFTTSGAGVAGVGGETYRVQDDYVHRFTVEENTTSYDFTPPSYVSTLRALIVAGGGPGGYDRGGGGGAGGLIYDPALALPGGTTYEINVGTGGVASANADVYGVNGGNSSIVGGSVSLVVYGGGAGGNYGSKKTGVNGGSGGGSAPDKGAVGKATNSSAQGHDGGQGVTYTFANGGGGGGATEVGGDAASSGATLGAGSGGAGYLSDISGESVYYAGGGGGGSDAPQSGKVNNVGRGGDGGGGEGGSSTVVAAAGQTDLGAGGGGGYVNSVGGNGGSGVVILRYAVQGNGSNMPEPAVSLTSAAYNEDAFTADVVYRVAWAGSGQDVADVAIAWGYSPDSLIHTNAVASGVIGIGTFSVPMLADQRTVYLRAVATNAAGHVGVSTETRSIYVGENENAPGDDVSPVLANVGVLRFDGAYVIVTGQVTAIGQPSGTCTVSLNMGLHANSLSTVASGRYAVGEIFALTNNALSTATTYYWQVAAVNDAGTAFATEPASFTTLGASSLNAVTVTSDQRTLTLGGSLSVIGGGVTYVLVRWNDGEWEIVGAFAHDSVSEAFSTTFTTPKAWGEATTWAVMSSNAYVTAEGVPTGACSISTPSEATGTSGSTMPEDKATYTWKPVDGDWNGSWSDPAHWSSNKADCRGYPDDPKANAYFHDCILEIPVTVAVDGLYNVAHFGCNGTNHASSITFVGTGMATSRLVTQDFSQQGKTDAPRSDTRYEFRDLSLQFAGSNWDIMKDTPSITNIFVRFSNVAINASGRILKLSTPYSRMEFVNGTTLNCQELSFSGTDTVLLVDDSTVVATSYISTFVSCSENEGVTLILRGAAPKMTCNNYFGAYGSSGVTRIVFEVPEGGYASAPLVVTHATHKFGEPRHTGLTTYLFEISRKSPALRATKSIMGNVLIQTASGFWPAAMGETLSTVIPEHGGESSGSIYYDTGADVSTARKLLLDLNGYGGLPFIMYVR